MEKRLDFDKADECGVWLAAILSYACINFGLNRVNHALLHEVVLKMSNDPTIPFTAMVSMRGDRGSIPPLPCFAEALHTSRNFGVDSDGEFAEFVRMDAQTAERNLLRISKKHGPGYLSVIARHAKRLSELLVTTGHIEAGLSIS